MTRIIFSILLYALFPFYINGQTCPPFNQTMFFQDFENPTSSNLTETRNSGTLTYSTSSGYTIGARSRQVNNSRVSVDYGTVNASFANNVKLSFYFAPQNIDYNSDNISFYVSTNGGTSWSREIEILSDNAIYFFGFPLWSIDLTYNLSSVSTYTSTYDGDNTPNYIYITDSNKKNKVEITIPDSFNRSNLRFRFQINNNATEDYWIIDDIRITGDFRETKTWNGTSWSGFLNNTAPTSSEIAIINGNYNTSTNGNINACQCTINTGKTLTIGTNSNATIQNGITNNGNLTVESNGNLVQVNGDNTYFTGNNITVKRKAKMKRLDYTYWSSPVSGQNLKNFSSSTLDTRFYVYNEGNDYFDGVFSYSSYPGFTVANAFPLKNKTTYNFETAKGYAIRAPNNYSTSEQTVDWTFTGSPNNGTTNTSISLSSAANGFNLIGNPYPSNIDFDALYNDNNGLIYQIAYFWTNTNPNPAMQGANYPSGGYINNYAIYSGTGGLAAPYGYISYSQPASTPTNIIKVGQGFIVKAKSPGGTLQFKNAYRTSNTAGVFFNTRMANTEKDRFWLELKTPLEFVSPILIGYVDGASNDFELDFDAPLLTEGSDSFYSILDTEKLAIQGRSPNFTATDKVSLGVAFFEPGNYEISIAQVEGIFNGSQAIYLRDKNLNTTVNLSERAYQFFANAGETKDRFEIVYKPDSTLGTDNISKNQETIIYENNGSIFIENKANKIAEIQIFDAGSRLLNISKPNDHKFSIEKSKFDKGLLIFKINLKDKATTKKFLLK